MLAQICFRFWQLDPQQIFWRSSLPPATHRSSVVDQHIKAKSRDPAFPLSYLLSWWVSPGPAGGGRCTQRLAAELTQRKSCWWGARIRAPVHGLLLPNDSYCALLAGARAASKPYALQQLQSGEMPEAANPGLSALEPFETFLSSLLWISFVTF